MQKRTRSVIKWDDLRYFLCVTKAGSFLGAGKMLGVDRTTVSRRIDVLERTLGCKLFTFDDDGFRPTPAGRGVMSAAERMACAAGALEDLRTDANDDIEGTVRLAVSVSLGDAFIADIVAFHEQHPRVAIEVAYVSDPLATLSERRADLAIGVSHEAPARLENVLLGHAEVAVYGPADRNIAGVPEFWIGWSEDIPKAFADWMRAYAPAGARVNTRVNSWDALKRAVLSGGGVAPLWCMLADREPGLARLDPRADEHRMPLWLSAHASEKRNAAEQAAWAFLSVRIPQTLNV
ncbi:LysR family transcriptional regulator [Pandoraea terrae]|uniref:LysR family transcriptional regulator n=1 Tax=Pandoraea terrae TaxID=1537710 RepID=A0A5E4SQ07_9BURK|nr:LysR family transcriptional regulator [Pandoraea terrae]VVD77525.1 LysR family transcriptional regulator [Pandoraea terrae]